MKKKDISRLLQRYLVGHQEGKDAYFDADEVDELLDSFEESDDYTYYDEVPVIPICRSGNASRMSTTKTMTVHSY